MRVLKLKWLGALKRRSRVHGGYEVQEASAKVACGAERSCRGVGWRYRGMEWL